MASFESFFDCTSVVGKFESLFSCSSVDGKIENLKREISFHKVETGIGTAF